MEDEDIIERVDRIGRETVAPLLDELAQRHEVVGEVRGSGMFWAVELVADRATREPLAPYGGTSPAMAAIVNGCVARGMVPFVNFNRIHVVPPLTATRGELREGIEILDAAIGDACP
jgi:taurine--2-oxoglutarate transaminase